MSIAVDSRIAELRAVPVFADLSEEQLTWFLDHTEERRYQAGDYVSHAGDEARTMSVILEGGIQVKAENQGVDGRVFTLGVNSVTGYLPFSRMKSFPMSVRATADSRLLTMDKSTFPAMYQAIPELIPKLVGLLTDRVRETATVTIQSEKLAALGKLSAGLAHELNNPAAAAKQASATAGKLFGCYQEMLDEFALLAITQEQLEIIRRLEKESAASVHATAALDSLERSDREQELEPWLEELGVEEVWKMAPHLVDAGWTRKSLSEAVCALPKDIRELTLWRLTAAIELEQVLVQMQNATTRIADLVGAMKAYSFMDRASLTEFDLNQNIETTLKMFSYRFKSGIELVTKYDGSLAKIHAHGGQMSQVWTNLIDNALDAIQDFRERREPGRLKVETSTLMDDAIVTITDNGRGVPEDVAAKIFEPFFTTKAQGEGTGLGLDFVYRIVRQHHGEVSFESKPGETRFTVRLPLRQAE